MLSAGTGCRGHGFPLCLLRSAPCFFRTAWQRAFSPSRGWPSPGSLRCPAIEVRGISGHRGLPRRPAGLCPPPTPAPGFASAPFGVTGPIYSAATLVRSCGFPTRFRARCVLPTQLSRYSHVLGGSFSSSPQNTRQPLARGRGCCCRPGSPGCRTEPAGTYISSPLEPFCLPPPGL